jgi:superfamily II DNA or RNA helicase
MSRPTSLRAVFDRSTNATFVPGEPGRTGRLALWPLDPADPADPDGAGSDPDLSPEGEVDVVRLIVPGPDGPETTPTPARLLAVRDVLDDLVQLGPDAEVSRSVAAWGHVARVAVGLAARGRLQPAIVGGVDTWVLAPLGEEDRQVRAALAAWIPPESHCLALVEDGPNMLAPAVAVSGFYGAVADSLPRTAAAGIASGLRAWAGDAPADVADLERFLPRADAGERTIVGLRVAMPGEADEPFTVELQLRSAVDPSLVIDASDLWAGATAGLGPDTETDLLLGLRRGARLWPPLERLLAEPCPTSLELADHEAIDLFGPLATDLAGAGVEVLIPSALTRTLEARAHVEPPPGAGDGPAQFDLATACELSWRGVLGGEPLTEQELSELAETRRPLVRLRGEWVVVDPAVVSKLGRRDTLSGADALVAALSGEVEIDGAAVHVEVEGAAADLARRLEAASMPHELAEPEGLDATLRPYQRRGVAWMNEMVDLGLGGVLADDMGHGKTIQLIALHLHRLSSSSGGDPTLVVCPATLVGNWQHELRRFAPGLRVHRYHGADRDLAGIDATDVVITTYGIARRDHVVLAEQAWGLVVADEAQAIKNPNASVSKAMRQVPAGARLALTGTPVENRLTELWSLLDWTTPGLLGGVEAFRRNVAIPIERDRDAEVTARFARIVSPFLLRRRKDDPEVAPDLPPKTETDHPVVLTEEQAGLYRAVVEEILDQIERADGIARRGLVLKLLTALKQVCNHPAHYLGQPGPLAARSGKLDAFDDLVRAIADAGDSTLVFTQYVAMGNLLMTRLAELGLSAEFLHGSLSLRRRTEMVERFQAGGFGVFVISLKAGGVGLNLTRATHVVHYDRWWNPAVENQASDRAWRIGQDRPVQVHRLISEGTLEERIATVLADKAALAEAVVGTGEAWLTELDDGELAALVTLGQDG